MDNPLVSIIILNYNGKKYLNNCLFSVLTQTDYPNFEVILVDNNSNDASIEQAMIKFGSDPRLKLVKNELNLGFSGGNNVGFMYAEGDFVVFLNNDTVVYADWLKPLVRSMQEDPTIGLAQSLILHMNGEAVQTGGWLFSDYLARKHGLADTKKSDFMFQQVFEVSVASGASMITPRALINEVGLFDAAVPFFYDDTLLSFKVWLANRRVVTISSSKICHMQGASKAWTIETTTYNLLKARTCLTFDVYYQKLDLFRAIMVNNFSTLIHSFFSMREKNIPVIKANAKGFFWGLRNFKFLWTNRLEHWSKAKVSSKELQSKFIRIKLPAAFCLLPSKLSNDYFQSKVNAYEKAVEA